MRGMRKVGYGIHALLAVVEMAISLAVAGRATNIGHEHSIASADQILHKEVERGQRLCLRAPMHHDDRRPRLIAWGSRLEKPRRNLAIVKRRKANELWGDERRRIQPAMRGSRDRSDAIGFQIPDVDVRRACREAGRKHEPLRIRGEAQLLIEEAYHAGRAARARRGTRDAAGSIKQRSEERRVGKECRSRWSPYH